jgi:hypothetical protein
MVHGQSYKGFPKIPHILVSIILIEIFVKIENIKNYKLSKNGSK